MVRAFLLHRNPLQGISDLLEGDRIEESNIQQQPLTERSRSQPLRDDTTENREQKTTNKKGPAQ